MHTTYAPPPFDQVLAAAVAVVLVRAVVMYGPALLARYRAHRRAGAEARRLRTVEINMRRSTWPQVKALPISQRDQAHRAAIIRVRYAGRGIAQDMRRK